MHDILIKKPADRTVEVSRMKAYLVFMAILALLLAGCASADAPDRAEQAANHLVSIKNFAFAPRTVNAKAGETIKWTNEDAASHTVKWDGTESPELFEGDSWSYTFDEPGTYDYICGIHPSMKGTIIVK